MVCSMRTGSTLAVPISAKLEWAKGPDASPTLSGAHLDRRSWFGEREKTLIQNYRKGSKRCLGGVHWLVRLTSRFV